jgi:pimeloyl-ACP methyl ester carboxylesterase
MALTLFDQALPNGITLSCRTDGPPDAPLRAIFLHGFPEAAFVWDEVMAALAPQVRSVAPNLRGYERSSAPADVAAYRPKHLVADLTALIAATTGAPNTPIDLLVAHDWGGGVAWNLAALSPHLIKRLVIINSPHPGALLRELRDNPAQRAASLYMRHLVEPDAAARLAADDFAGLWATFNRSGNPAWLDGRLRQRYREVWSQGLDGALNYYRASPLRPPASPADTDLQQLVLPPSVVNVAVPTTVLWGDDDHALLPGLLAGLADWVPGVQIHRHAGASHWIVHEQPAWVVARLREVLNPA